MAIEERAKELYCDADGYVKDSANDYMRLGYIKGADEMVTKACDAYCYMCTLYRPAQRAGCIIKDCQCDELERFKTQLINNE